MLDLPGARSSEQSYLGRSRLFFSFFARRLPLVSEEAGGEVATRTLGKRLLNIARRRISLAKDGRACRSCHIPRPGTDECARGTQTQTLPLSCLVCDGVSLVACLTIRPPTLKCTVASSCPRWLSLFLTAQHAPLANPFFVGIHTSGDQTSSGLCLPRETRTLARCSGAFES